MYIFAYSSMSVPIAVEPVIIKLINVNNLVFWSNINFSHLQSASHGTTCVKRVNTLTQKD